MMKKLSIFLSVLICFISIYSFQTVKAYIKEDENHVIDEQQDQESEVLFVEGYVFKDNNHSGHMDDDERISQMKINLWQENNLADTAITDEEGYYYFEGLKKDKKYQITAECFSDCTLMKRQKDDDITNDFTIMQDYQVKTEEFVMNQAFRQYNLGFTPIAYHIEYHCNGGVGDFQQDEKAYSENEKMKIQSATSLKKEGYVFQGWNTKEDSSGQMYQGNEVISMPPHNMILYAIWKKDAVQVHHSQDTHIQKVKQSHIVDTSDDNISTILLMFLSSVGGLLVTKSLRKNR